MAVISGVIKLVVPVYVKLKIYRGPQEGDRGPHMGRGPKGQGHCHIPQTQLAFCKCLTHEEANVNISLPRVYPQKDQEEKMEIALDVEPPEAKQDMQYLNSGFI